MNSEMSNLNFRPDRQLMSNRNFRPGRQQMSNRNFGPDRQERFVCDVCTNRDTCEHGFQTYRIPRLEELEGLLKFILIHHLKLNSSSSLS